MIEVNEKVEVARISGAVAGVTIYGLTLNEWVAVATLTYLIIQIIILVPKAIGTVRKWLKL
jgi:hypothetical protein